MLHFVKRIRSGVQAITFGAGAVVLVCVAVMAYDGGRRQATATTHPVPVRQDDPAIVLPPPKPEVTDGTRPVKVVVWYDDDGVPARATVWWIERVAGKRDHRWTSEAMGVDEVEAVLWQAGLEWRE